MVSVLRGVDSKERPVMGYIYELMDSAKENIAFFFSISKSNCIKKAWSTHESIHEVYKATRQQGQREKKKAKKIPYLQPNQSKKSKMDHEVQSTCSLTQSENMYKKNRKIAWSVYSVSSKILLFLSFHKVQNKHKGAAFHAFFLFFPTKVSFQPRMVSLIELGKTQWTPKKAQIRCQIIATLGQWINTWFADSSSALHK